jgi:alpha-1,3-rhamnosyl/mannosyltransferase
LSYDVPVVITIHDLSWLRYPQTHPADRVRWLEKGLPKALHRASAIVVDSEFVRSEVLSAFGVPPERVTTAHLGVSSTFRPRTEQEVEGTLRTLGLRYRGYVLVVATIEPRKNLARVLEAFTELAPSLRERCPLVVAGAPGWRGGPLVSRLNRVADRGHVRFLGHVGSRELPGLYAGAALFVFPSLYEGFGLPPLEAMASGVPVIVSDRASLPEVVGDAGRMVDPERPDEIAACIAGLLDDEGARRQMASRGLERASLFTWDACARVTLGVYRDVLGPAIRGDANVNGLARRSL